MGINATPIRCVWDHYPNPDCASIHIDRRLPDTLSRPLRDEDDPPDESRDARLVMELELIEGVEAVSLHGYCCQVVKGVVFDWSEIKAAVQDVLGRHFGAALDVRGERARDYRTPSGLRETRAEG